MDKAVTILGIITAVIIVIVIIYFAGTIMGLFKFGKQKDSQVPTQTETQTESQSETESETEVEVAVPNVVGKSFEDAKKLAEDLGLTLYAIKAKSSSKADGTILELLDLEVGKMVAQGTQLNVVIAGNDETLSKLNKEEGDEEETVDIPNVTGKTKSAAESALKAAGFNYSESYEYSTTVEADMVISQSKTGKAKKGETISIVISQGKEAITVPNVVGKSQTDAQTELANAGLNYAVNTDYSDSVAEGKVISQTNAGSKVQAGTTITITVSLGSKLIDVPNVVGMSENSAGTALENAGFHYALDYAYSSSVAAGNVISQNISGKAEKGKTVTIVISKGPKEETPVTPPEGEGGTGGSDITDTPEVQ